MPLLIVASLSGALLGFGFVGLATRRFLSDPRLPPPPQASFFSTVLASLVLDAEIPIGPVAAAGLPDAVGWTALGATIGWIAWNHRGGAE